MSWMAAAVGGSAVLGYMGTKSSNKAAAKAAEPKLWDQAAPYVDQIMGDAQGLYGQQGFAPDPNQLQLAGRQQNYDYATGQMPGLVDAAQQSWMSGLNPGMNPHVPAMIEAGNQALTQGFNRDVLPRIASGAVGAGQFGGSRQGIAEGLAAQGLQQNMTNMQTGILNNAYNQGLGQQRAAWAMSPQMAQIGLAPGQAQQDVGAQYQFDQTAPVRNLEGYSLSLSPWTGLGQGGPAPQSPIYGAAGAALVGSQLYDQYSKQPGYSPTGYNTQANGYLLNLPGGPGGGSGGGFGFN